MHYSEFSNKYVYLKKIADKKLFKRIQQNNIKKRTWRKLSHNFSKRETRLVLSLERQNKKNSYRSNERGAENPVGETKHLCTQG